MGYLFVFAAVFCGAVKGFCGKKISAHTASLSIAAYLNFLRMLLCIVIGFLIVFVTAGISAFTASPVLIAISAFSGIMSAVMVISWLFSVRGGAYMLADVFLTVGVIVPMLLSSILFGESIMLNDIVGLLALLAATGFLCSYSSKTKRKIKAADIIVLSVAGISNGLIGFSQKMFNNYVGGGVAAFNFYTYLFAAVALGVFFLITRNKAERTTGKIPLRVYIFVTVMAICLFGYSLLNTLAAAEMPASQLYPLSQGSSLIVSTSMASLFFGEKIKPRLIIGICLAFVGLLIINLL